jgi:nucleoside-diphosphate-sugar epimerase
MKVLVTGGSGYVGSNLVRRLADQHEVTVFETQIFGNPIAYMAESHGVRFIQGDVRSQPDCFTASEGQDAVIHLAGVVTDELVDMNPQFGHDVNVQGTMNVALAAVQKGVGRFIYASSSSVYGTAAEAGVPDEQDVPRPKTKYATQKLQGEVAIAAMFKDTDVTWTALRQATAMGPAPRMRLDTVVNIFSKQAYFDGVITPYGGAQYRSNVHVDDVADFYELLLKVDAKWIHGRPWNLTQQNLTVMDIAKAVQSAGLSPFGKDEAKIQRVDIEDARSYRLDGTAVENDLGFKPERTIGQAAVDNFEWFEESGIDPEDPIYYNNKRMADIVRET